jgi:signal transduction histidine kinase
MALLRTSDPQQRQSLLDLQAGVSETIANLRRAIGGLRPIYLEDLGLVPALEQYARTCPDYLGIDVDFEAIGDQNKRLPRELETTLYRVVQESLTNVARHSGAHCANILLKIDAASALLIIEDHGVGFDMKDLNASQAKKNRLGVYGMEERVALVGGTLSIESAPGEGTSIRVDIPIK